MQVTFFDYLLKYNEKKKKMFETQQLLQKNHNVIKNTKFGIHTLMKNDALTEGLKGNAI